MFDRFLNMLLRVEFQDTNTGSKLEMEALDYCTEYGAKHVRVNRHIHHNFEKVFASWDP